MSKTKEEETNDWKWKRKLETEEEEKHEKKIKYQENKKTNEKEKLPKRKIIRNPTPSIFSYVSISVHAKKKSSCFSDSKLYFTLI